MKKKMFLRRKNLFIYCSITLLASMILYASCKKTGDFSGETSKPTNEESVKTTLEVSSKEGGFTQNHLKSEIVLKDTSSILQLLLKSDEWNLIPSHLLNQIDQSKPIYQTYDNVPLQSIIFHFKTTNKGLLYKSLVIYAYNGKFLPVIIKSEKQETGYTKLSITDLNEGTYLSMLANKDEKVGKFKVEKNIPFEKITGGVQKDKTIQSVDRLKTQSMSTSLAVQSSETCMQSSHTFSDCMNCAIKECSEDWVCYVGCGVHFVGCMAVFAAACAFHS